MKHESSSLYIPLPTPRNARPSFPHGMRHELPNPYQVQRILRELWSRERPHLYSAISVVRSSAAVTPVASISRVPPFTPMLATLPRSRFCVTFQMHGDLKVWKRGYVSDLADGTVVTFESWRCIHCIHTHTRRRQQWHRAAPEPSYIIQRFATR